MRRRARACFGALAALTLVVAACGGDDDDDASGAAEPAAAGRDGRSGRDRPLQHGTDRTEPEATTTDGTDAEGTHGTEGDTPAGAVPRRAPRRPRATAIKVGILHSLSGTMSISEVAVRDAELLAIEEINAAGGVLGKQIEAVVEDGASDWPTFAEKAEKLLTNDKVAAVFGGWTSASRKAMLPVFEGLKGLLFYPVQYEGLEASPNIFYTGATTNQQIIPALDYLKEQGMTKVFLVGSDYVFPRTANKIIKAYADGERPRDRRRGVPAARRHQRRRRSCRRSSTPSPTSCSTPSTATATWPSSRSSRPRATRRTRSRPSRCRWPRKRSAASASTTSRATCGLELLPDHRHAQEHRVRRGLQGQVRRRPRDRRPDRGRLQRRLHLGRRGREGRLVRRRRRSRKRPRASSWTRRKGRSRSATGTSTSPRRPASA